MRTYNKPMIAASTILNADLALSAMELKNIFGYTMQVVITGTPTGTFKLQVSCDPETSVPPGSSVTNWTDLPNATKAVSAAGSFLFSIADVYYNFVRLVYTDGSSGASTAHMTVATLNAKGT